MRKVLVATFFMLTIGLTACGGSSEKQTSKVDEVEAKQEVEQNESESIPETEEAVEETTSAKDLYGYVEPTGLGDSLSSLTFGLNGKYYQFPMPLSEFLDAGWKIPKVFAREDLIQPGEDYEIALENEAGAILYEVRIKNTTEEPLEMKDCLVNRMLITADQGHDFTLPEGISFSSTEDEIKAVTEQGSIIQNGNYTTCVWDNEAWTDSIMAWYHPEVGLEFFECNGYW